MTFIRKIKKKSGTYLAEVQTYREEGKVKQKVIKYLGKEIENQIVRKIYTKDIKIESVKHSLDILTIDKTSNDLKLNDIENKNILALVYSQLLEKRSINKLEEWLRFTEIPDVLNINNISTKKLYESLRQTVDMDFEKIEAGIHSILQEYEQNNDAAIIDVTDTYFESSKEKIKPRKGKDGKVRKLIQIGLAVSLNNGFPIFHKIYSGNLSNIQIYKDMAFNLKKRNMKSLIIDRGMMSKENLDITRNLNLNVIAGIRKTNVLIKDYIYKIDREEIYSLKNRVKLKNTSVYINGFDYLNGRLIVVYNPSLEILKKEYSFEIGNDKNRKHIGHSLIYHNTNLDDNIVVRKYYEKEIVERAFKQLKGVLNLRPIRVWLKEHVEGHIRICYMAYAILSFMNYRLKEIDISAIEALNSLKMGYRVKLFDETNNFHWNLLVPLEPKQKDILKCLGVVYKN